MRYDRILKSALETYSQITSFIDQKEYQIALVGIEDCIFDIGAAYEEMPLNTVKQRVQTLQARMRCLKKSLTEENTHNTNTLRSQIDESLPLIELGLSED